MLQTLMMVDKNDVSDKAVRVRALVEKIDPSGHYNSPPRDLTEITDVEVMGTCMSSFYPEAQEMRQFLFEGYFRSFNLFYFFDGTGVAQLFDHMSNRLRWFKFGCVDPKHSIHYCPGCGHSAHFDSSD